MADPKKPRAPFAPWDRRELPGSFDVEESARRVGNYKWIEMRLFEALGGWVATVPELDVKMRLGTHCYHHAWHAELWHKRLPELREMNPDRLTQPANDELVAFIDAMTEPEAPELTIEKLVGVYRVLIPHKIAAYTYHLNNTRPITDAPTIRSLEVRPPGRVRRLARRRDADPVAHRDARRRRAGGRATRPGSRSSWSRPAASPARARSAPRRRRRRLMRQFFPVEELARDERFHTITMRDRIDDPRVGRRPRRTPTRAGARNRLSPEPQGRLRRRPRADARHLRRRDPGPRGRRAHLLGLPDLGSTPAPTTRRSR